MIQSLKIAAIVLSLLLTGCAATVSKSSGNVNKIQVPAASAKKIVMTVKGNQTVSGTSDWKALRDEWRTSMSAAALSAGLGFSYHEADAAPASEAGTLVSIKMNDYRYVSAGSRVAFGIMTGNAFLDADVEFSDLQSRRVVGTRKYSTSSSAWEGAFSAMTNKQVQAVCKEIVDEVTNKSTATNTNMAPAALRSPSAVTTMPTALIYSDEQNTNVPIQMVEHRGGVSSVTVEKIAKNYGCTGNKGAGLITPQGPVEVYRMACDNGKAFLAKCELRQCSAM